jgi:hypothetical protein
MLQICTRIFNWKVALAAEKLMIFAGCVMEIEFHFRLTFTAVVQIERCMSSLRLTRVSFR